MPARLRDLVRALAEYGVAVEEPNGGSHWLAKAPGKRVYPLPAGNGLKAELSDVYVKGVCRHFGIDYKEFKKRL